MDEMLRLSPRQKIPTINDTKCLKTRRLVKSDMNFEGRISVPGSSLVTAGVLCHLPGSECTNCQDEVFMGADSSVQAPTSGLEHPETSVGSLQPRYLNRCH